MQGRPFTGTCSEPPGRGLASVDEPPGLPLRCREVGSGSSPQDHPSWFEDEREARKQGGRAGRAGRTTQLPDASSLN